MGVGAAKLLEIGPFQYQRHFEHKIAHLDAKESVLTVLYCITTSQYLPHTHDTEEYNRHSQLPILTIPKSTIDIRSYAVGVGAAKVLKNRVIPVPEAF